MEPEENHFALHHLPPGGIDDSLGFSLTFIFTFHGILGGMHQTGDSAANFSECVQMSHMDLESKKANFFLQF